MHFLGDQSETRMFIQSGWSGLCYCNILNLTNTFVPGIHVKRPAIARYLKKDIHDKTNYLFIFFTKKQFSFRCIICCSQPWSGHTPGSHTNELMRPALPNSVTFHHSNSTNWMLTSARRCSKSIAHLIPSHGHRSLVVSGECVLQVRAFVPTLKPHLVHRCSLKVRKDYVATTRCDEQERGFLRFWNTFSSQDPGIKHACQTFVWLWLSNFPFWNFTSADHCDQDSRIQ